MADELFLIDGNSLAYRAFFALPESIATSTGVPTNAIFGFASMLVKILTDYGPKATVVVWDAGSSGRKEVYSEYKAGRATAAGSAQGAVAASGAAGGGVRLPQHPGRRLRGRRRDRVDRRAGQAPGPADRGDDRHRRSRRLSARRRTGLDHDHQPGDHRHQGVRPPGRDRPLRDPARARARLPRAQGRHVGQHPRRSGDRRQDRRRPAQPVRVTRERARTRSTRSPAPSASRT